jgi:hypothetical protein
MYQDKGIMGPPEKTQNFKIQSSNKSQISKGQGLLTFAIWGLN